MMKREVRKIPELRFPEFDGEWKKKECRKILGNSRAKGNQSLPIYSVTQDKGLVPRNSLDRKMGNDAKAETNLYVGPQYLTYNMMRMWQGAVGIAEQECMVSPAYIVLKPSNNTCSKFCINLFQRRRSLYLFWAYSYGLTDDRLRLYYKNFASIVFSTPTLPEQQKIASFLYTIGKKIEQLTSKKELLSQYKKGVMQKIFSQEIRFKDDNGQDYPDWEEKRLGEIFECAKGQGLSKSDVVKDGRNKCILYGELYTTYREIINEVKSSTDSGNGVKSKRGDLLIPCSTTTTGVDLADVTVINEDGVLIGGDISILSFKNQGDSTFFAYYLTHAKKYEIAKYAQGSTIIHLYFSHFKKTYLIYPESVNEQKKIANLLSTIDSKINSVQAQLTQTQNFKKGLLQKMFV